MIQEALYTLLAAITATGGRVYPSIAPTLPTSPFIVYDRVSAVPQNSMSETASLINSRVQIDVYAQTYSEAQTVAASVVTAMNGWSYQNIRLMSRDLFEFEARLHGVSIDFSIWHV